MAVKENLIAARALIDTPEKWGKGSKSFPLDTGYDGKCLCAHGALFQALSGNWGRSADVVTTALWRVLPNGDWRTTPDFNDHPDTTHADIMSLFDRAIAAAS